ncbi:hypothetical protein [Enterobacter cloacae complex sp. ESBL7]|uniref:hypothetical protein n=1 Tax=Enterobacter cloacae complex sp. ESBL7 TaxID=3163325 RepID=UPI003569924F
MLITNEILAAYFGRMPNAEIICPVCKNIGWKVNGAHVIDTFDKKGDKVVNHIPYSRLDEETDKTTTFMGGFPVIFLVCPSCGYMRLHSYKVLRDNIMKMDAPGDADG